MSELSLTADADPFSPDFWGEIDWQVKSRPQGSQPINMKRGLDRKLVRGFNLIEDGRSRLPDKIFISGEVFDPAVLPEHTIIAFEREYYLSAGHPNIHQAQAMLEEMSLTQMNLAGSTTFHTADGYFDAQTGMHWKMRYEIQNGIGLVIQPISTKSLYAVREIRRPARSPEYRRLSKAMSPLGEPKAPVEIKTTYEYINLCAPVNGPCRVGISNEAPVFGDEINPYQRRIERFNSVRAWAAV
jgi:hypothetical protein